MRLHAAGAPGSTRRPRTGPLSTPALHACWNVLNELAQLAHSPGEGGAALPSPHRSTHPRRAAGLQQWGCPACRKVDEEPARPPPSPPRPDRPPVPRPALLHPWAAGTLRQTDYDYFDYSTFFEECGQDGLLCVNFDVARYRPLGCPAAPCARHACMHVKQLQGPAQVESQQGSCTPARRPGA